MRAQRLRAGLVFQSASFSAIPLDAAVRQVSVEIIDVQTIADHEHTCPRPGGRDEGYLSANSSAIKRDPSDQGEEDVVSLISRGFDAVPQVLKPTTNLIEPLTNPLCLKA